MDIVVSFPGGKRVDARVGGFLVATDQSVEGGGQGSAPQPYDLFLASLATCAGIYALGFCQARGVSTEGLEVVQRHEFDPDTHLPTRIRLEVTPPVGFPEKYLPALQKVVDKCKVKRTLQEPPAFDVVLKSAVAA